MKKLKIFIVAIVLFIGAEIQAQKIGYINVTELMIAMPEMKIANEELQKLKKTYQAQLQDSFKEFENKRTQYSNEASSKTDEENQKRAEEIKNLRENIQKAQIAAEEELRKKEQELMAPISKKAKEAIDKIANSKGLEYVLDASPGGPVIVAKGLDILADVKKELGF